MLTNVKCHNQATVSVSTLHCFRRLFIIRYNAVRPTPHCVALWFLFIDIWIFTQSLQSPDEYITNHS